MAGPGRNARCPCGSDRKVKYCCGERRGPSDADLATAALHREARKAAAHVRRHSGDDLDQLIDELAALPTLDHTMLVALPHLVTPDIEALRGAIEDDDSDAVEAALPAVAARCDTPQARLRLLQAVQCLRDERRIDDCVADVVAVDLAAPKSMLAEASLIESVAVHAGAARTASGLVVMAR